MEYNDLIEVKVVWNKRFTVHYRVDPIPHTGYRGYGKSNFYAWYKRPYTTQERRRSLIDKEYVRGRRSFRMLPSAWEDQLRSDKRTRKSWKNKKIKRQWQKNSECNSMVEDQPSKLIMGVQFPPFAPKEIK